MNAPENRFLSVAEQYARVERQLLIDGQWRPAVSGKTFDVYNPATGEVIARVAEGDAADVDLAVTAARAAFPGWAALPPAARSQILWKVGELIDRHAQELAALVDLFVAVAFETAHARTIAAQATRAATKVSHCAHSRPSRLTSNPRRAAAPSRGRPCRRRPRRRPPA